MRAGPAEPHACAAPSCAGGARIALAHDWLVGRRGGEAVLDRIAGIVLDGHEPAGLYTMFHDGRALGGAIDRLECRAWLPGRSGLAAGPLRRWMLPLYPLAVASLSRALAREHARRPIDLLLSTSSAAVQGLRPPPGVPHLCYCHAPARYLWTIEEEYAGAGAAARLGLRVMGPALRAWDARASARVTRFVANSTHTAHAVRRCYGRDADVVHPPVRTDFFTPEPGTEREGFWLFVGALEPYKRADLAIAASALAARPLVIVGEGSQGARLRAAAGANVRFLGRVDDVELRRLYRAAALLVFPQVEDFGIVAVEAQACGLPVVARRRGGALDTVIDGATGSFFDEPAPQAVAAAAARVPANASSACRASALRFSSDRFDELMRAQIARLLATRANSQRQV